MEASLIPSIQNYLAVTPWWILLVQAFLIWIVYLACKGIFFTLIIRASGRYRQPVSYERQGIKNILLVGDSTAVGTGAKDSSQTLGGFLARDFPRTNIINRSINGSLTRSVLVQLVTGPTPTYDMIIISTGGNDVWSMTRAKRLRRDIRDVLQLANYMSGNRTVLIFFGNEGSAPFFPIFLTRLLMRRTEVVRKVFLQVATEERVPFIELFSNARKNPFVIHPKRYFAPDGLHPNDAGYWEWYKHLWRLMVDGSHSFHER